ncbi:MAG TPA: gluconate 2-dehydrogenase subunit 3 family protein [Bryobacteraceae bacterium]|nr:gluconate 2-dehydrogenase subunit 3 family protein [Bryobacteraceae bacterium]
MSDENQVSRRDLLRGLSLSAALATSGAGLVSAQVAQHMHAAVAEEKSAAPKGEYRPKYFNAHEFQTLQRLADLIIPADGHSPGALEAHAAEWIDYMSSNSPELAEIFTGGFGWLDHHMQQHHSADFVDATPQQQAALLDVIAFKKNETPETAAGVRFFAWARNLVTDAYYTSPIGIKELGYMGNTAVAEFHVPEEALQYALKRSLFA